MSRFLVQLLVFCTVFVVVFSKHIHPKHIVDMDEDSDQSKPIATDADGMSIDLIRRIKPSWFVPVNSALYFERYPPCEEGYERDLVGVCREVW